MVDEIAGIKSINSSAVFVSYKAVEGTCAFYLMFLTSKQKRTRGDKGYEFFSYVLIM